MRRRVVLPLASALALVPAASTSASVDAATTGGILAFAGSVKPALVPIGPLKSGLDALSKGRIGAALAARNAMPADSLDRAALTWAILTLGGGGTPSAEIAAAAEALKGWPGAMLFRKNSERALFREKPAPDAVVRIFAGSAPQTFEGVVLLARAHRALGDEAAAARTLLPFWKTAKLEARQEAAILREFGTIIPRAAHRFRMERMLHAERVGSAERVAKLAGAEELAAAWAAVIRKERGARKLLDKVPRAQRAAGFAFAEAKFLRRAERFTDAARAMLGAPADAEALVDPDAWWIERRVLARELVDAGDVATAYRLVASHQAESATNVVDAEFHAGWYALRGLKDARTAARHFARIAAVAEAPASIARAHYWLGRAADAGGPGDAEKLYAKAAAHGTTFYGQLAAHRLGRTAIAVADPSPSVADLRTFEARPAVRAIARLEEAGYGELAETLYRGLAAELTSPGELALLAARAERRGDHFLALKVGKGAAARGMAVGALTHPVGVIPRTANISGAGAALAYAVARQESEFNVGAVSGAGARGLLQLLPGTAKEVARKAGLPYSKQRLTTDPGYNATLGAAFLAEQLGRFDGSYVLTFAGYNAGPGRAREWVKRYGDPRGKDIETVVDWIERIPFSETRTYVQRVMENYQVYKMRLQGEADIGDDLVNGR